MTIEQKKAGQYRFIRRCHVGAIRVWLVAVVWLAGGAVLADEPEDKLPTDGYLEKEDGLARKMVGDVAPEKVDRLYAALLNGQCSDKSMADNEPDPFKMQMADVLGLQPEQMTGMGCEEVLGRVESQLIATRPPVAFEVRIASGRCKTLTISHRVGKKPIDSRQNVSRNYSIKLRQIAHEFRCVCAGEGSNAELQSLKPGTVMSLTFRCPE
jgi:hypothetical protein